MSQEVGSKLAAGFKPPSHCIFGPMDFHLTLNKYAKDYSRWAYVVVSFSRTNAQGGLYEREVR